MKPDVVAPGYKILAPRAHATKNNYDESYETFGTSFSAPVVSGNAALIRQYFEEGWFPCGSKVRFSFHPYFTASDFSIVTAATTATTTDNVFLYSLSQRDAIRITKLLTRVGP